MAVGLKQPSNISEIDGIKLSSTAAGIRYQGRDDIVLIEISPGSTTAAVFTQNKFCAAPIVVAKQHLKETDPRYLIINAGNANAGTGSTGLSVANQTTEIVANELNVNAQQVLPFSTGVIGEQIDADKFQTSMPILVNNLNEGNWLSAASAIMTTDTIPKAVSETVCLAEGDVTITGIAKGSGMIQPNMATMLSFIATDIEVKRSDLQTLLNNCTEVSFNSITVDSDTSTNDACVLIATGKSKLAYVDLSLEDQKKFTESLGVVMKALAQAIVRDGEGATKFVSVDVRNAANEDQAKEVAYSVANSPLVKTALAASDPNWGRILAAAGKIHDNELDLTHANLKVNDVSIWAQGELDPSYSEEKGKQAMSKSDITILLELGLGEACKTVWTTDLTHEYVSINADYRT